MTQLQPHLRVALPMRPLRVHHLPQYVDATQLAGSTVVVIDVLRATTTICQALAAGAADVVPFLEVDDALAAAAGEPDRSQIVLGGERGGRRIDGFDLGNLPSEYTPAAVGGKRVLLTTTNGTRAMDHARQARRIVIGSLVNRAAVAAAIGADSRIDILCAGTDGHETGEDILAAGAIVERLLAAGDDWQIDAAADAARDLWQSAVAAASAADRPLDEQLSIELRDTPGGRNLLALGMEDDLAASARVDTIDFAPELNASTWRIATP